MKKKTMCFALLTALTLLLGACGLFGQPLQRRVLCASLDDVRTLIGEDFHYPVMESYPDVSLYQARYFYTLSTRLLDQGQYVASGYEIELTLNRDYAAAYGQVRLRGTIEEPAVDEYDADGNLIRKPAPPAEQTMRAGDYTIRYSHGTRSTPEDPTEFEQFYAYYSQGGVRHSISIAQIYPHTTIEDLQAIAAGYFAQLLS